MAAGPRARRRRRGRSPSRTRRPAARNLDPDIAEALAANPGAGQFFDGLAQFYRTAYVRWIAATKRNPDQRPVRLRGVIRLLEAGEKERPKPPQ
jgi:uncharacterized protein YdeI (YjbR/CyaY-like superfamily)